MGSRGNGASGGVCTPGSESGSAEPPAFPTRQLWEPGGRVGVLDSQDFKFSPAHCEMNTW